MVTESIRGAIEGPLAGLGLLVEDIGVTPAGRRRVVRVAVDRDLAALELPDDTSPVAPLTLDEVAEATRVVDDALETRDVLGSGSYVLEVSSPGVERPLTEQRHLRRNVGRLVTVRAVDGGKLTGRILAVSGDELLLDLGSGTLGMPVGRVASARVEVEFGSVPGDEGRA